MTSQRDHHLSLARTTYQSRYTSLVNGISMGLMALAIAPAAFSGGEFELMSLGTLILVLGVLSVIGFRSGTVIADDQGLTIRTFLHTRRVEWRNIAQFSTRVGFIGPQALVRNCYLVVALRSDEGHGDAPGIVLRILDFNSRPSRNGQPCYVEKVVDELNARLAALEGCRQLTEGELLVGRRSGA